MHIRKTKSGADVVRGFLDYMFIVPRFEYTVAYKGFVASGPDLGACIAACHGSANQNV